MADGGFPRELKELDSDGEAGPGEEDRTRRRQRLFGLGKPAARGRSAPAGNVGDRSCLRPGRPDETGSLSRKVETDGAVDTAKAGRRDDRRSTYSPSGCEAAVTGKFGTDRPEVLKAIGFRKDSGLFANPKDVEQEPRAGSGREGPIVQRPSDAEICGDSLRTIASSRRTHSGSRWRTYRLVAISAGRTGTFKHSSEKLTVKPRTFALSPERQSSLFD